MFVIDQEMFTCDPSQRHPAVARAADTANS
jgi:hypothetical protein